MGSCRLPADAVRPRKLGLIPMGWGIEATVWAAQSVAGLPGNVWSTPRLPMYGLVLIVLGGLWLCLWHGRWRVWGMAGIAAGFATMLLTRPPDIVLADFGRLLAARAADGNYYVAAGAEKLTRSFLMRETGAESAFLAEDRGGGREPAAMPGRGTLLLHRKRPPGRAGDERGRAADHVRHGRCDRRSGARRVRLPVADPDRGPDRQLASRRLRAVARSGGIAVARRERQCQPRRPSVGAASGLGPGARPPRQAGNAARGAAAGAAGEMLVSREGCPLTSTLSSNEREGEFQGRGKPSPAMRER